ncbi:hypothetical protein [Novosphingobium sp.]|uniref:hypothetical protein n=1 Tax=Novosphingobium sp. TaxID=1874826 RepID=UPI0025D346FE|nr:hypothetical protein [Novosphingobium sp.]MCC6926237.1 hypothetical protein [Novosphingobium sp.]
MTTPPAIDDRFAHWPRWPARLLLAAVLLILTAAALVPIAAGKQESQTVGFVEAMAGGQAAKDAQRPRDDDLALYDRVIERIGKGENYYAVAADEHRQAHYPLRPGVAVRLPTLAYLAVALGDSGKGAEVLVPGVLAAALVLLVAVVLAWWKRLGEEPGGAQFQRIGTALVFMGASLGLNRYYFVLHELWAGMLIALSLALHRPGRKWLAALLVAALALAIREHVLPYVLLMGALALWRRDWKEGAAWAGLVALFGLYLTWHLGQVAQHVLPSDPLGPSWLELRGLSGWLSNVVLSSNLRFLPHFVAGPLVMLMVLGWAGWKSPLGTTATLLYLGYGLAFMIAGRPDNFYWGAVIAPAMFVGLAFAPQAVGSLLKAALPG